ncbi:MAG: Npun_R2821/Npun_R2822 family protein [Elainella sp.]
MQRGIYITANDRVIDQTIALLKSIRTYDSETPVILIPYDDHYQGVAEQLRPYGVTVYEDLEFIERLSCRLQQTFGESFFARPNQFRKQACWFGPFDQFLYIDTDIVVFEKIINTLDHLNEVDFICADYQHAGGIANVFSPTVLEAGVFSPAECQEIFNCGFWGANKGLISEADLYEVFSECAAHPDYFDFSQKTSDQPIINYMVLKRIPRRRNLVRQATKAPGNWAGSPHFVQDADHPGRLLDPRVNQLLQYLHWAGFRIQPGCPYWEVWEHYRYLGEEKPVAVLPAPKPLWKRALAKLGNR